MKLTATPVFRPTADSIWNSFRSSNKQHLFLTGGRSSGKTRLFSELCRKPVPGITAQLAPDQGAWIAEDKLCRADRFDIGDPTPFASGSGMDLFPDGLRSPELPALRNCLRTEGEWTGIDAICCSETGGEYTYIIRRLMDAKHLIAVVQKQDSPFFRELHRRNDVFWVDLDNPYGNAGCIIMASGLGRRFGGNKLMADFRGKPLICSVLSATEGIFRQRLVVTRHASVAALCRESGVEAVLHDLPHRSDTVRIGMEALMETDCCMFCAGDQPLLRRETVSALALAAANDAESIWRAGFESTPGSPVLFPKWAYPQLMHLPEGKGGAHIAKKYPERIRMIPVRDKYELMDVDCQEDLAFLSEQ